jgi:hypothetical protein
MRTNALHAASVKGKGFSPYVKVDKSEGALAPDASGAPGLDFETWDGAVLDGSILVDTIPWCAP